MLGPILLGIFGALVVCITLAAIGLRGPYAWGVVKEAALHWQRNWAVKRYWHNKRKKRRF